MQAANSFPASAANSLITGYCDDFISLAASMAQTLEQATMRALPLDGCSEQLARVERGMRDLADAIGGVLATAGPKAASVKAPGAKRAAKGQPAAGGARPQPRPQPKTAAKAAPPPAGLAPTLHSRPDERPPIAPRATPGLFERLPSSPVPPQSSAPKRPSPPLPAKPARPGPRAMPVAPAEAVPPVDNAIRRPAVDAAKPVAAVDPTRVPPRPSATSMLAGTNETMPLRSVFQFLSRMRKSGTMRVTLDTEDLTFDVGDGCLIATTSNRMQQGERLGDLLVELGFVAPMDLEVFAQRHGQSMRQLGGALVQAGRITEGQLAEALELQVARRFKRAVAAPIASYDFRECPRPRGDGRIRIRAFEMLNGSDDESQQ